MGKQRHSKDRLFITRTEQQRDYTGHKGTVVQQPSRVLPFDHCALSLTPFTDPVCTYPEGIIFDQVNLSDYADKYKCNPITGERINISDIFKLNIARDSNNNWYCPVSCKVFNNSSHVVAIKSTGNVYMYEVVNDLNIKTKKYFDLITNEPFVRNDIITLQNPSDAAFVAARDINNFAHLRIIREENTALASTSSSSGSTCSSSKYSSSSHIGSICNGITQSVLKELETSQANVDQSSIAILKRKIYGSSYAQYEKETIFVDSDCLDLLSLKALTEDVNHGQSNSTNMASSSLTSSATGINANNCIRLASADEIRQARWRMMRKIGKKGYVRVKTTQGNLNVELHCDIAPCTSWNFIQLCKSGYYNDNLLHRLIPGFMVQGGDGSGTSNSTQERSAFPGGAAFVDEFDSRLQHDTKGVVSMANSGSNSNKSQFFITFAECNHLNNKHSIFGRIVGGIATLDRIQDTATNKSSCRPLVDIRVLQTEVLVDPVLEADAELKADITRAISERMNSASKISNALPDYYGSKTVSSSDKTTLNSFSSSSTVGKYVKSAVAANMVSTSSSSRSSGKDCENDDELAKFLQSTSSRSYADDFDNDVTSDKASRKKMKQGSFGNYF